MFGFQDLEDILSRQQRKKEPEGSLGPTRVWLRLHFALVDAFVTAPRKGKGKGKATTVTTASFCIQLF